MFGPCWITCRRFVARRYWPLIPSAPRYFSKRLGFGNRTEAQEIFAVHAQIHDFRLMQGWCARVLNWNVVVMNCHSSFRPNCGRIGTVVHGYHYFKVTDRSAGRLPWPRVNSSWNYNVSPRSSYKVSPDWRPPFRFNKRPNNRNNGS